MTGFAAGIHYDDLRLGDIVIARMVQDYSTGKLVQDNYKITTGCLNFRQPFLV